jgi:AraC-like DNA-binding protein
MKPPAGVGGGGSTDPYVRHARRIVWDGCRELDSIIRDGLPLGPEARRPVNPRTTSPEIAAPPAAPVVDVALLERLFDLAPDVAFFVKDAAGRYVAVNDSLVARHGLASKSDVLGRCPRDICPGEFGRVPAEQDEAVLRTGRPLVDHLEMHWHQPNDPVWCLTTKLPILDPTGAVVGLIGFSRDVRAPAEARDIPAAFARALDEFERTLSPDVTPAWLARRSGLSAQRVARLTKRLYGLTPGHFITRARVTAAVGLLRDPARTVAGVAHACGFYDHSAFTRAFRSATGLTPSEFRGRR